MSSRRCFRMIRMLMDEKKARQVREVKAERLRKKEEVEEVESMVRLRQAESDMFRTKAVETWAEARRLKCIIAQAKTEKPEQDFVSLYLKRRLEKVEAEKQRSLQTIEEAEMLRNNPKFHDMFKSASPSPKRRLKKAEAEKQRSLEKIEEAEKPRNNPKIHDMFKSWSPSPKRRPENAEAEKQRSLEKIEEPEKPRNYPEFEFGDMFKARNEEAEKRRRELPEAAKQWLLEKEKEKAKLREEGAAARSKLSLVLKNARKNAASLPPDIGELVQRVIELPGI